MNIKHEIYYDFGNYNMFKNKLLNWLNVCNRNLKKNVLNVVSNYCKIFDKEFWFIAEYS